MNTRKIGTSYEDIACRYLVDQGFTILDRNWRWSNKGELDIVAKDPKRFGKEYLVFIEVKYRGHSMRHSLEALGFSKLQQLKKLAAVYLLAKKLNYNHTAVTFDFIAIHNGKIQHLRNIA